MHCMTNIACLKNKSDIPAYEINIGLPAYYLVGISHVNNLLLIAVWNSQVHLHRLLWDCLMLVSSGNSYRDERRTK